MAGGHNSDRVKRHPPLAAAEYSEESAEGWAATETRSEGRGAEGRKTGGRFVVSLNVQEPCPITTPSARRRHVATVRNVSDILAPPQRSCHLLVSKVN
jgi:hypothetical protein